MRFYKFRTMVVGADRLKARLLPFNERRDGPLFKMRNDPRVTRVGRLLRKYSLDEFPQMLNVLQGSMSLVGPRPHLPEEVAAYQDGDYLRLECIPGIVGLPQIVGRNTLGFKEWVELDLRYRRGWSLVEDLWIIARTLGILLAPLRRRRGAGF
jgi:lipopolysaccharide/colanic/teichoic acid biosynthesis glycosyltransferase